LGSSVGPARRDHGESTIADELDQVRAVQRAPPRSVSPVDDGERARAPAR
jgi:hypothetical protein